MRITARGGGGNDYRRNCNLLACNSLPRNLSSNRRSDGALDRFRRKIADEEEGAASVDFRASV